jgi:tetratricopeptide (TPR) repeat protein
MSVGANPAFPEIATARNRHTTRCEAIRLAESLLRPGEPHPGKPQLTADFDLLPGLPVEVWAADRLCTRGTVVLTNGNAEKAYSYLDAAITLKPTADAYFMRSVALAALNDPAGSLEDIDVYMQEVSNDPSAHALRGDELHELKRTGEAIRAYDRALQLDEKYHAARLERGLCYLETGTFQAALRDLEKVEPFIDADADYWKARAEAYSALGRDAEANASLKHAKQQSEEDDV